MKRAILTAVVLSLFASAAALADPRDERRDRAHPRSESAEYRHSPERWHHGRGDWRYDRRGHDRDGYYRHWDDRRHYDRRHYDGRHYDRRHGGRYYDRPSHGWRHYPPHYRQPPYYRHGHWKRGDRLPRVYYAPHYVVRDYHVHRLYAPPRGCHWVRVDGNLLLVALATGVVLDVISPRF